MGTLNYTTTVSVDQTVGQCQAILAKAGASHVGIEYEDGHPSGLSFGLRTPHGVRTFRMPVDVQAVWTLLGKQEAARRLKAGFGNVRSTFGEKFVVLKDEWAGDHIDFRASLLGQTTTGTVDVAEDHVRLEVQLPWMLSLLANKAKALVQRQGKLMLEKPTKPATRS